MNDCIFCRIVEGKEEAKKVKETKNLLVIEDINPQASIHLLIIPKKHVQDVSQVSQNVWDEIRETAVYIARVKDLKGYRLIHNAGDAATIPHMQVHFLADTAPEKAQ